MLIQAFNSQVKSDIYLKQTLDFLSRNRKFKEETDNYNKNRRFLILHIILAALFLLAAFTIFCILNGFYLAIGFAVLPITITAFGIYFPLAKKQKQQYLKKFLPCIVEAIYGGEAKYEEDGILPSNYLENLNLFPIGTIHTEDKISGSYNGVDCMMIDINSSSSSSKNHSSYFHGMLLSFRMDLSLSSPLILTENECLDKSLKEVTVGSEAFRKKFRIYGKEERELFEFLTPDVQNSLSEIEKSLHGDVTFLFRDKELIVSINASQTEFFFPRNKNYKDYVNIMTEAITPMAYIIDTLKLDDYNNDKDLHNCEYHLG